MKRTFESWEDWRERLLGGENEDLTTVLTNVRAAATRHTRAKWAQLERTRGFCDLGLYLLYEHHFTDIAASDPAELKLFRNLSPETLEREAPRVIVGDVALSDSLSRQAWCDTWRYQAAYFDDLMSYLFRAGPTNRRMHVVHDMLGALARVHSLGDLVRAGCAAEVEATFEDPVLALQTFIQAALPGHPTIRARVSELERVELAYWARLYERLLPTYGLTLRADVDWLDMAQIFNDCIAGTLLRARGEDKIPRMSSGEHILTATMLSVMPALCGVSPTEFENRRPQEAPPNDN